MTALTTEVVDGVVAVVTFDLPGEPVNKFTTAVQAELAALFDRLDADSAVRAAVLLSGKADTFIAGADIDEFLKYSTAAEFEALSAGGHRMMARLEVMRVPVVFAIHGACLGGGLEAALAAPYRIATDHAKTVLALPEVQLGIIPGAGGTQRLPRTIGLQAALDLILTGKNVRARKALQLGLVDEVVHPSILRAVAVQRAREFAAGQRSRQRPRHKGGARELVLEDNPLGRAVVFRQAREMTLRKTRGHYPAPLLALEAVQAGYAGSVEKGFAEEARLFGEAAATAVSRELINLFFATNALKKDQPAGEVGPRPVRRLAVLGTGFMGAGIAAVSVPQGIPVRFKDTAHDRVGKGLAAVREVLKDRLTKKQVTRQEFEDQLSLLSGTTAYTGFGAVDLAIEAVFEDLAVKHAVLREAEAVLPPHAVFATNTSTIPIARIAEASARPERVIGMHFFSPVHKMPLLEVIVHPRTAPEVLATAVAFGRRIGKTVIVVNDHPGFYVNRILAPYINEAGRLLDEGVAVDAVDDALTAFGFPVGPITLVDEVGIDVAGKSGRIMAEALGDRLAPPRTLTAVVEAGRLGRKGKRGFYLYDADGTKGAVDPSVYELTPTGAARTTLPAEEIQRRCVLALVNEAARCLEEGIIRSARDGDIGAVFGFGFPPFRGGPFRYLDAVGVGEVVRALEALNAAHPGRFTPAPSLVARAGAGPLPQAPRDSA